MRYECVFADYFFDVTVTGDRPCCSKQADRDFPGSAEEWFDGFNVINPIEYIAGIAPRPLLLVHGSRDETVDVSHAHRLYERAGDPRQIVIVDGAGHRLRQNDRAMAISIDWLKSHCQK